MIYFKINVVTWASKIAEYKLREIEYHALCCLVMKLDIAINGSSRGFQGERGNKWFLEGFQGECGNKGSLQDLRCDVEMDPFLIHGVARPERYGLQVL